VERQQRRKRRRRAAAAEGWRPSSFSRWPCLPATCTNQHKKGSSKDGIRTDEASKIDILRLDGGGRVRGIDSLCHPIIRAPNVQLDGGAASSPPLLQQRVRDGGLPRRQQAARPPALSDRDKKEEERGENSPGENPSGR
jgi:hypothetical protein